MNKVKTKSKQAIQDGKLITILQDKNSTGREREKAFNDLYSKHTDSMFYFFVKTGMDKEGAEDLRVLTFQKVYEKVHTYDANTSVFSTWLHKIAKNTMIDEKRKGNFEQLSIDALSDKTAADNDGMVFEIKSNQKTPHEQLVLKDKVQKVKDVINAIDNDLIRNLLICKFLKDYSYEQIAEELDVPNNSTLRVNVGRGTKILLSKLPKDFNKN